MKKVFAIILFFSFIASGCAYYTCPTYAVNSEQDEIIQDLEDETQP